MKAPLVTPAVVEYFDGLFPDRCPDPALSEREVWMAAGAARVVKKMKSIVKEQEAAGRNAKVEL